MSLHRAWRAGIRLALALALLGAVSSCGSGVQPTVAYQPDILPIKINVSADGVSVEGSKDIITPIGVFSIGAQYALPEREEETIYVIVRDRKKGNVGYDTVYKVRTGKDSFSAIVNGTTSIEVHDGQVIIDVTDGSIQTIEFKRAGPGLAEQSGGNKPWSSTQAKWNAGYDSSWYHPFALAKWAYDDSTIGKWCGVGFVWFLLRLVLSLVLGVVDIILSVVFLLAQLVYMAAGATGRNIVWGLFVLLLVVGGGAFVIANN